MKKKQLLMTIYTIENGAPTLLPMDAKAPNHKDI